MITHTAEIEESLLKDDELREWRQIDALSRAPVAGGTIRYAAVTLALTTVLVLLCVLISSVVNDSFTEGLLTVPLVFLAATVLMVGGMATFKYPGKISDKAALECARAKRAFLARIRYESRVQQSDARDYGSDHDSHPFPITGHYDPQRYYRYSTDERSYMRENGITADEYDANRPD